MIKQKSKQKIYAFIDSQNLNLGVRSQGWMLDWRKFRQYLRNKYSVEKAYLFIGQVAGNEALYAFLQECNYILIFKPTLEHREKDKVIIKGNVDAELVLHLMIQYKNYDKALIVSGDGDFHCLIEYLEEKKKLFKILAPTNHYSSLLRKFNRGNYIIRIDLLRSSLEQKKTGIRVRSKP
ncbi:MAG: NYN domain-containing protein [Patescibacteria group bacterium]